MFKILFLEVLQQIRSNSTLHSCCLESAYNDVIVSFKQKLQLPQCQHSNIKHSRYRSTNSCSTLMLEHSEILIHANHMCKCQFFLAYKLVLGEKIHKLETHETESGFSTLSCCQTWERETIFSYCTFFYL